MTKWDLPKGWEWVSLGSPDHFIRRGGGTPSKSRPEYWDDGTVPWLSSTELDEKQVNIIKNTKLRITKKGIDNSSAEIVPKNSILLTCTASIGKVAINHIDLATNQQFNSFECKKGVLPKYVAYYLLTQKNNLIQLGGTTSFCHITIPSLSKIEIPLPPLETQQKIVAILDKAEEIKRLRAEANAQTQKLIQSVFLEMFGDPVTNPKKWGKSKISELIESVRKWNPIVDPKEYFTYIDIESINNDTNEISSPKIIKGSEAPSRARQIVNQGDILFSTVRPYLRNIAIVGEDTDDKIASTGFMIMRPKKDVIRSYLFNVVLSPSFLKYIGKFYRGANYPAVNESDILDVEIPVPSELLLNEFTKFINEIENNKINQIASANIIETFSEKIRNQAFKGELIA